MGPPGLRVSAAGRAPAHASPPSGRGLEAYQPPRGWRRRASEAWRARGAGVAKPSPGGGPPAVAPPSVEPPSSVPGWRAGQVRPRPMGRDRSEKPQGFVDSLPDWVGYGLLYLISVIPVIIAGSVVVILFLNSLK